MIHKAIAECSMLSKCSAELRPTTRNASAATLARDPWTVCLLVMLQTRIFTAGGAMARSLVLRAMGLQGAQGFFNPGTCEDKLFASLYYNLDFSANRVLPIDLHWCLIQKSFKETKKTRRHARGVMARCSMLREWCPRTTAFTRHVLCARSASAHLTPWVAVTHRMVKYSAEFVMERTLDLMVMDLVELVACQLWWLPVQDSLRNQDHCKFLRSFSCTFKYSNLCC